MIVVIASMIVNLLNSKSYSYQIADGIFKIELKSGVQYNIDFEHLRVFDNYTNFSLYFNSENINEYHFNVNNYAILVLTYDACSYTNVVPIKYTIDGKILNVTAYQDGYSTCEPLYAYYAVKDDKDLIELDLDVRWIARDKNWFNKMI